MKPIVTAAIAALIFFGNIAFQLSMPEMAVQISPGARDYVWLVAQGLATTGVFYGLLRIAQRLGWPYWTVAFGLVLLSFINLTDFVVYSLMVKGPRSMAVSVVVGVLYPIACVLVTWRYGSQRALRRLQLAVIPLLALIVFHGVPRYIFVRSIDRPYVQDPARGPSIHLLIYDGMAWERFYDGGSVSPELPHFRALAESGLTFLAARPSGGNTARSLSQLLTGRAARRVDFPFGEWSMYGVGDQGQPLPQDDNLFSDIGGSGVNLVVNGFYLPYLSYLGEHMTKAHQMPLLSSPLARNLQFLLRALLYPPHVESHQKSEAASAFYRKAIREAPVNTLFYMHFNQPHTPMPYDEEGAVISRLDFYDYAVTADLGELQRRYFDSMKKVDWRLGETLDLLRAEGKYEDSLIIVTSDHNSLGYSSPYVPLVIKAPGGAAPATVRGPVTLTHLRRFLGEFRRTGRLDLEILRYES